MLNLLLSTKIISEKEACISKLPVYSLGVAGGVEGLENQKRTMEARTMKAPDETESDGEGFTMSRFDIRS
jgi:hypothetical protein